MKKIFTLILIATGLSFAASAQNGYGRNKQDRYPVNNQNGNWDQSGRYDQKDYGYNKQRRRNNDYDRQAEYNRQMEYDRMNRECDQRIEAYRNDRRLDRYERERRIQQVEYERQQKAKAFGKGVVVGGIAAILLGVLISGGR